MAVVAGVFALVYARSLTFTYIEGDDATSVAYHAFGRLRAVQPPYSAYQCGMDAILGLLPANEAILRVSAMLLSALAAPVLVFLIVALAYDWAGNFIAIPWPLAALIVPLAAPELIYLGLLYTPALVALSAAIGAHLMVRRSGPGQVKFWASAALFGAGVACRWDILAYGAIVAADLWLIRRDRFRTAFVWGAAAIAAWLGAIWLNGYGLGTVLKTLRSAGPVEGYPGPMVAAATVQTLATPALVLLAAIGFVRLAKRRHPLALVVLLGMALTARYLPLGVPKWFLVAVPGVVACALIGFSALWPARRAALVPILAAPWLIGIHTLSGDSAYGPGFEVRPFDRPLQSASLTRPVLGAGALVPTSEGPRPLGGHAYVLLGGGWRRVARQSSDDLHAAVQQAVAQHLPLLQDNGQGYTVATLAGMGFITRDPWNRDVRTLVSADGAARVRVLHLRDREVLFSPAGERQVEALAGSPRVVAYAYTSTLRRLYRIAPGALEPLGRTAAILDFDKMAISAPGRLP
jgi:hypothetical protein